MLVQWVAEPILQAREGTDAPDSLRRDPLPRVVFISASDGHHRARVAMGAGRGIVQACRKAVSHIAASFRSGPRPRWLKIDVVQGVHPMDPVGNDRSRVLSPGIEGMAFGRECGAALLPEETLARGLVSGKGEIRPEQVAGYLDSPSKPDGSCGGPPQGTGVVPEYRFTTLSLFTDGKTTLPLYRGHRLFEGLSKEGLLQDAQMAEKYLTRAVDDEGRFVYLYRPVTDDVPKKYNILRHGGTSYAMLELYETTGDKRTLDAARRALRYIAGSTKTCPGQGGDMSCVVENGHVKLGGNALAAVALAKYCEVTGDRDYVPLILSLVRWIRATQKENGEFTIHKQRHSDGVVTDFVSRYYPGEALLALVRTHQLDPENDAWLDAAERSAKVLVREQENVTPSVLSGAHWMLYALKDLYRLRPDPKYLEHAFRLADVLVATQNRETAYPDWEGGYFRPPRNTATAVRTEALCSAHSLARDFNDPKRTAAYLAAVEKGVSYQLQTQCRPETAMYFDDPGRCLGGFHAGLTDFDIRIDQIQHNISGILALYRIMNE